jgi:hypothetical protein
MNVKMAKEKKKMAVLPRSAAEKYTHQEKYMRYVAHADEVAVQCSRHVEIWVHQGVGTRHGVDVLKGT